MYEVSSPLRRRSLVYGAEANCNILYRAIIFDTMKNDIATMMFPCQVF
jgi:hypothetical protein